MNTKTIITRGLAAVFSALLLLGMLATVIPYNTHAQDGSSPVQVQTPREIVDATGTNAFGFSTNAAVPYVRSGTNIYPAISTNLQFLRFSGAGGTNTLVIRDGIITAVQ